MQKCWYKIKLLVKKGAIDFDNYLPLSKIHKCNKEIIKFLGDCKMYNDALIRFVNIIYCDVVYDLFI